jgi:predicted ATPase
LTQTVRSGTNPLHWPELTSIVPESGPAAPDRDGRYTQLQVFQAATAFLCAVADIGPVVLVLEDLHWADSTSIELRLYVGRHLKTANMLVLGTYRDVEVGRQHPLQDTLRELTRERLVDDVRLSRLDVSGTAALLSAQLAAESISDELVALVHERAEGNLFFTEELLKAPARTG